MTVGIPLTCNCGSKWRKHVLSNAGASLRIARSMSAAARVPTRRAAFPRRPRRCALTPPPMSASCCTTSVCPQATCRRCAGHASTAWRCRGCQRTPWSATWACHAQRCALCMLCNACFLHVFACSTALASCYSYPRNVPKPSFKSMQSSHDIGAVQHRHRARAGARGDAGAARSASV